MNTFKCAILVLCAIAGGFAGKFPTELPRCTAGDTDCLTGVINQYIEGYSKGLRNVNLVSLDPLYIDKIDIIQSAQSPVNINLKLKNVTMFGLSGLRAYKVVGFEKDPSTSKFEIYGKVDRLALIGQYTIKGSVIVLPVTGSGPTNFTFENVDFKIKCVPRVEVRKGKTYLQFEEVKLDFTTSRLHIVLENLFNGDRLLSDTTNRFLNENWSEILMELKPVLRTAIGDIIDAVISPVFARFPYANLFL